MTLLSENLKENKKETSFLKTELKTKALFYQQVGVLFEILNAKKTYTTAVWIQ